MRSTVEREREREREKIVWHLGKCTATGEVVEWVALQKCKSFFPIIS